MSLRERIARTFNTNGSGLSRDDYGKFMMEKDDILAEVDALEKATTWQPLSATRPPAWKDVLLYTGCRARYVVAHWDTEENLFVSDYHKKGHEQFIHYAEAWMPLPQPPKGEGE